MPPDDRGARRGRRTRPPAGPLAGSPYGAHPGVGARRPARRWRVPRIERHPCPPRRAPVPAGSAPPPGAQPGANRGCCRCTGGATSPDARLRRPGATVPGRAGRRRRSPHCVRACRRQWRGTRADSPGRRYGPAVPVGDASGTPRRTRSRADSPRLVRLNAAYERRRAGFSSGFASVRPGPGPSAGTRRHRGSRRGCRSGTDRSLRALAPPAAPRPPGAGGRRPGRRDSPPPRPRSLMS